MAFDAIPYEMRAYPQWVMWRYEDTEAPKPTKVPYSPKSGRHADVHKPETWGTFDECLSVLQSGQYAGIGFVLTENDPYGFIDLDDPYERNPNGSFKHAEPQVVLDRQINIYNEFDSYAERSPSGSGLHIIVKGAIPSGRKRSSIEIYSSMRFMTMTGDVYRNATIRDHNDYLNALYLQMGEGKNVANFYAGLEHAKMTNEQVLEMAGRAQNKDKFNDLFYEGNWQNYYPSQSEADFALVDILAFYSENRRQVQELFLQSALGQREKSRAQYRINYMLNRCFDNMSPPVDIDGLKNKLEEAIAKKHAEESTLKHSQISTAVNHEPATQVPNLTESSAYTVPPGLMGHIAQFIYAQAPRPVPEIALAGAIGLMSGIVGRSYNVSNTGLNQYVLLLAGTGTGKEAIASGIDKLMTQVVKTVPAAMDFIGPGEIASAPAIMKYMSRGPTSFVSMVGEFGLYLQQMASIHASPALLGLRRFMLDAFNKSGEGKVMRPSIYSDKDKNTAAILAPAWSVLGESTPEKFYEGLHEGLISEGLLPRFTMIEYHGERPYLNEHHASVMPSFQVVDDLSSLCAQSLMLNSQHKAIHVQFTNEAKELFRKFNLHCDDNMRTGDREIRKELWNRAHIKALKLAGLVAVGCNPYDPIVNEDAGHWAINVVLADVRNMLKRFDAGEIGVDNDETKQLTKVIDCVKAYVVSPWQDVSKYTGDGFSALHSARVLPYSYLQRRLACVAVFRKDRIGATGAIKRAVKTLVERGDIQEVSRATMSKDFNTTAVSYMISHPHAFGL